MTHSTFAFVAEYVDRPVAEHEADHVMTSWHAGESVEDVAFFFVHCTDIGDHHLESYLLVHIGDGPGREALEVSVSRMVSDAG